MPIQTVSPTPATFDADERLRWVERVAHLMDSQFRLPGTRVRFGLDPLLGLLPIVGDLSTTAVSVALLLGFGVLFALVAWGSVLLLRWGWHYFDAAPVLSV